MKVLLVDDHTLLLPSTIFEADDTGRSYRLRPNTRSIWLRNLTLKSGVLMFFLVPDRLVKFARETDFRDRAVLMHAHGRMVASYVGIASAHPGGLVMFASPHISRARQ